MRLGLLPWKSAVMVRKAQAVPKMTSTGIVLRTKGCNIDPISDGMVDKDGLGMGGDSAISCVGRNHGTAVTC